MDVDGERGAWDEAAGWHLTVVVLLDPHHVHHGRLGLHLLLLLLLELGLLLRLLLLLLLLLLELLLELLMLLELLLLLLLLHQRHPAALRCGSDGRCVLPLLDEKLQMLRLHGRVAVVVPHHHHHGRRQRRVHVVGGISDGTGHRLQEHIVVHLTIAVVVGWNASLLLLLLLLLEPIAPTQHGRHRVVIVQPSCCWAVVAPSVVDHLPSAIQLRCVGLEALRFGLVLCGRLLVARATYLASRGCEAQRFVHVARERIVNAHRVHVRIGRCR